MRYKNMFIYQLFYYFFSYAHVYSEMLILFIVLMINFSQKAVIRRIQITAGRTSVSSSVNPVPVLAIPVEQCELMPI